MSYKDIIIDGPLPAQPHVAAVLIPKSDSSGFAWHVLAREEDCAAIELDAGATAYKVEQFADLEALPAALKTPDGDPINVFGDGLHLAEEVTAIEEPKAK